MFRFTKQKTTGAFRINIYGCDEFILHDPKSLLCSELEYRTIRFSSHNVRVPCTERISSFFVNLNLRFLYCSLHIQGNNFLVQIHVYNVCVLIDFSQKAYKSSLGLSVDLDSELREKNSGAIDRASNEDRVKDIFRVPTILMARKVSNGLCLHWM